jgi:hypothetical protein
MSQDNELNFCKEKNNRKGCQNIPLPVSSIFRGKE